MASTEHNNEDDHEETGVTDEHLQEVGDVPASPKRGSKKKRDATALRKAPQAPKRFKSSYICFFMAKQPEIKGELGDSATVTAISKRSAEMWKHLPTVERAHWDDVAAKDKQRYMLEKASYTGPWQVPWKRAKKDPSAPKRPMSAFLYFSMGKRTQIKEDHPDMKNTEVSRLLGEMWRNAPEEDRLPHIEKEKAERDKYKSAIAEWRTEFEAKQEAQRKVNAEQLSMTASMQAHEQGQPIMPYPEQYGQPPPMGPPGFMYQGYPYPNYYQFPTNGKQPVVLGPSGTPHYHAPYGSSNSQEPGAAGQPPSHMHPPPGAYTTAQQDYGDAPSQGEAHFDYPTEEGGVQTAE